MEKELGSQLGVPFSFQHFVSFHSIWFLINIQIKDIQDYVSQMKKMFPLSNFRHSEVALQMKLYSS